MDRNLIMKMVLKEVFKIKHIKPFLMECTAEEIILLAVNTLRMDLQKEDVKVIPWRNWKGDKIE